MQAAEVAALSDEALGRALAEALEWGIEDAGDGGHRLLGGPLDAMYAEFLCSGGDGMLAVLEAMRERQPEWYPVVSAAYYLSDPTARHWHAQMNGEPTSSAYAATAPRAVAEAALIALTARGGTVTTDVERGKR